MTTIETILSRMMKEPDFAEAIFVDTEKTLESYGLSANELALFQKMTQAQFRTLTADERKSMIGLSMGQPIKDWIDA